MAEGRRVNRRLQKKPPKVKIERKDSNFWKILAALTMVFVFLFAGSFLFRKDISRLLQQNNELAQTALPNKAASLQPTGVMHQGKRMALVIGNSSYNDVPYLKNPVSDAKAIAETLEKNGFTVILETDLSKKGFDTVVREFGRKLHNATTGIFFFAGHGMQVNGLNYLLPVDVHAEDEADVKYGGVDSGYILKKMSDAGCPLNIMILDACRNNPFRGFSRGTEQTGLAQIDAPRGSLIAYATQPKNVASDGGEEHSPYTAALLKYMNVPGLSIEHFFKKVRQDVAINTEQKQIPWESTSLLGDFSFLPEEPKVIQDAVAQIVPQQIVPHAPVPQVSAVHLSPQPQVPQTQTPQPEKVKPATLTVHAVPKWASVRVLNIAPQYSPGMALKAGRYEIEVSAENYQTAKRSVDLADGQGLQVDVHLLPEPIKDYQDSVAQTSAVPIENMQQSTLTVHAVPENSKIRILNIGPKYTPGMALKAGKYHIEVTASDYQAEKRWVTLSEGQNLEVGIQLFPKVQHNYQAVASVDQNRSIVPSQPELNKLQFVENSPPNSKYSSNKSSVGRNFYDTSAALVVGNGNYQLGWSDHTHAVQDARDVANALRKRGFLVTLKTNITKSQFDSAMRNFIAQYGGNRNNRLLFYYTGRGYTRSFSAGVKKGYLLMTDSDDPAINTTAFELGSVALDTLQHQAAQIRSEHVLFLLDTCLSDGIFNAHTMPTPYRISSATRKPVRQFIAAGSGGDTLPSRSSFKKLFIDLLSGKRQDPIRDGYLSGDELGFYFKKNLPSKSGQHPQYAKSKNPQLNKGDFLFFTSGSPRQAVTAQAGTPVYIGNGDRGENSVVRQARLTVKPDPSYATIRFMNKDISYSPGMSIDAGDYQIEISAPGHGSWTKDLKLTSGRHSTYNIKLQPAAAR